MEDVGFQLKERDIDVAVATKRCHLRQSEVGLPGYNVPQKAIKKPQPHGLKPGDGEQMKHTGPAPTIKG